MEGWQYNVTFVAGGISSTLSMLGSILVSKIVMQKRNDRTILDRLMLGLSISDVITSAANLSQPFALPISSDFPYAIGNKVTCQITGFWMIFTATSGVYSAGLAIYFYCFALTDRSYEWPRRIEPFIHGIAWSLGLSLACASVQYIRPRPVKGICFVTCDENCIDAPEVVSTIYTLSYAYVAILALSGLIGIFFTSALWRGFKRQHRRSSRYATTSSLPMLREVATQAAFYIAAYMNSLIAITIATTVTEAYAHKPPDFFQNPPTTIFLSLLCLYLLFPLQGFLNCLVYTRPRLLQWREVYPSASWFWCFRQVFYGRTLPARQKSSEAQSCPPEQSHDVTAIQHPSSLSSTKSASAHIRSILDPTNGDEENATEQ